LYTRASTSSLGVFTPGVAFNLGRSAAEQQQFVWAYRCAAARERGTSEAASIEPPTTITWFIQAEPQAAVDRVRARISPVVLRDDAWSQQPETSIPAGVLAAFELSDFERDRLIRSVVSSEAIEGVDLSYQAVARILDRVLLEPPIKLG
jgi:hypothetical protein